MSVLTRLFAPAASGEPAAVALALLADPARPGRAGLFRPGPGLPLHPPLPFRPIGLAHPGARLPVPPPARPVGERPGPVLHCPPAFRDDPALGAVVNERLVAWAEEVGIYRGRLEQVRSADFGRLIMLTHPDTDDPDRLLAAAKCALAEWASDDYYCADRDSEGAGPLLGARLMVADATVAPAHLPPGYAEGLRGGIEEDPVLLAFRSAADHLARYASPPQLARFRQEIALLFVGYAAEAAWRAAKYRPPVWEYLACRQVNSFLPCITLTDAIGGYDLPPEEYADPRVRRVLTMAATASTLVNDLYSLAKEADPSGLDYNLPSLIAAEEGCSTAEAVRRAVRVHDELVLTFEAEGAVLAAAGSPALRRFLIGVWAWLGGGREWHAGSARYRTD
ncbi:Camphene synthase [Kitasatospora sp. MMS16-BH015]|uniref:family 2 encapsulin nanocompartment cargo protein terpene cyclase n=1 Tax=Kitasatospora sp. MMS16-BH015 TaxID=2018025 RepID=UPI000CA187ED|nr:family 2 encapsulin nanocompartment cargo protein terpene cyclase [Kitasatospora sp. MMS16-BH015]AUG79746.1 Camphene synthase [Kitasatospora sp. MMS16-BH015]